jgi:hypothetical protein
VTEAESQPEAKRLSVTEDSDTSWSAELTCLVSWQVLQQNAVAPNDEQNAAFGLAKVQLDAVGPNVKVSLSDAVLIAARGGAHYAYDAPVPLGHGESFAGNSVARRCHADRHPKQHFWCRSDLWGLHLWTLSAY